MAHGNPTLLLPQPHDAGRIVLQPLNDSEPVWRSHTFPGTTDAIRADAWHGHFAGPCTNHAVLPPGMYRVQWLTPAGDQADLDVITVSARCMFEQAFLGGFDVSQADTSGWLPTGRWMPGADGLIAQDHSSYLFREAAMHGTLRARFATSDALPDGTRFGLIARHYNATSHLRVVVERSNGRWTAGLECVRLAPGQAEQAAVSLAQAAVPGMTSSYDLAWSFNGSSHAVTVNGNVLLTAVEDFMGGVDVIGLFGNRDVVLATARMDTAQAVETLEVAQENYEARIQPGNLRSLRVRAADGLQPNVFWESGCQFGHIGGSEIKFTQGARLFESEAGPVATVVNWQGPMPKFVEQSRDVRGVASGQAHFYPDRILLADDVLAWVSRSVGPDLDLLGRRLTGPARVAFTDDRQFHEWVLPENGRSTSIAAAPEQFLPACILFPFEHAAARWWLQVIIDLRFPQRHSAQYTHFAWQCPRGLTASHDFRVRPSIPGQTYGFSVIMSWWMSEDGRAAEDDLLAMRDAWTRPMEVDVLRGAAVTYASSGEQPREAMSFAGCFDRATGRYTFAAEADRLEVKLQPGPVPRRGVTLAIRQWRGGPAVCCSRDGQPLCEGADVLTQVASDGELWVWLREPVLEPTVIAVTADHAKQVSP